VVVVKIINKHEGVSTREDRVGYGEEPPLSNTVGLEDPDDEDLRDGVSFLCLSGTGVDRAHSVLIRRRMQQALRGQSHSNQPCRVVRFSSNELDL